MTEINALRIVISIDDDCETTIFHEPNGYSDVPEVIDETQTKIRENYDMNASGWRAFQTNIERAIPGGWEYVTGLGGSVAEAYPWPVGTYATVEDIEHEYLRSVAAELWEEARAKVSGTEK